jgi:hypothetical protein
MNKNKTAIAPIYIISMKIPIISPFNKIKLIELIKKVMIKKKTAFTGLNDSNIKKEDSIDSIQQKEIIVKYIFVKK